MASREPGHCELFSGAFTLLARAAGYPTRVVTGYLGGSWNGYENYFMVRNRDAHAWCEMFDAESRNWLRVDPTPGSGRPGDEEVDVGSGALSIDRTWRAYVDSLRILWYRRIVNFDEQQQEALASQARDYGKRLSEWVRGELARLRELAMVLIVEPLREGRIGTFILNLLGVILFFVLLRLGIQRTGGILSALRMRGRWRNHPVRMKAGRWIRRFDASFGDSLRQDNRLKKAYGDLLLLRFGEAEYWPSNESEVLKEAKRTFRVLKKEGLPEVS